MKFSTGRSLFSGILILTTLAILLGVARRASAYTPESPKVKAMVTKAVKFLEGADHNELGGECLIALALLKAGKDVSHRSIVSAITKCQQAAKNNSVDISAKYSLGLAIVFLCEVGPNKYKKEIESLLNLMVKHQQRGGGWGYDSSQDGDTSQTQYAVLSLWAASHAKIQVPEVAVERVLYWLIRTQDPRGGWGYTGSDPGNNTRVRQADVSLSLSSAGLGSVYICADILGIKAKRVRKKEKGLPPALIPVGQEKEKEKKRVKSKVAQGLVARAMSDGNGWFDNNFNINQNQWGHYYRYALERYASFRELAENSHEEEPQWYNEGVDFLAKKQNQNGSWDSQEGSGAVGTSFAVLFLTRSTRQSIGKNVFGDGTMLSGRGLPKDTTKVRMVKGRVVGPTLSRSMKDLLAILESGDDTDLDELLGLPGQTAFDAPLDPRDEQAQQLRRLVSKGKFQARIVAVRTLAKTRKTENVPVLIYALSDPDPRVVKSARDGLRFVARKFNGFGLSDKPSPAELVEAQKAWKKWYLSIRPDAEFLD